MTRDKSDIPHLFDRWNEIAPRIHSAKDIRLFMDFDGTLAAYRHRPEDVTLTAATTRILERLGRHRRLHMAIVSGRRNAVLRRFVQIPRIQFMGLFGSEYKGNLRLSRRAKQALRGARAALVSLPIEFPGVVVEEKGVSFAIHSRGASPDARRELQKRIRRSLTRIGTDFRVIRGDYSWEIVPRQVRGKGVAMREFTRTLQSPFLPIYIGDEVADEPAFSALRRGVTIRVGAMTPTKARFRLNDSREVCTFLERLEEELS